LTPEMRVELDRSALVTTVEETVKAEVCHQPGKCLMA
jgi:hypothetical protein